MVIIKKSITVISMLYKVMLRWNVIFKSSIYGNGVIFTKLNISSQFTRSSKKVEKKMKKNPSNKKSSSEFISML